MADAAIQGQGRRVFFRQGTMLKVSVLALLILLIVLPLIRVVLFTLQPDIIKAWSDVLTGRLSTNLFYKPLGNTLIIGGVVATDLVFEITLDHPGNRHECRQPCHGYSCGGIGAGLPAAGLLGSWAVLCFESHNRHRVLHDPALPDIETVRGPQVIQGLITLVIPGENYSVPDAVPLPDE